MESFKRSIIGLHDFRWYLPVAQSLTPVICHVVHCYGSFLLQDMFFKSVISTVCKCSRQILVTDFKFAFVRFSWRRRCFTSRKIYVCLEKFPCLLQLSDRAYVSGARDVEVYCSCDRSGTTGFSNVAQTRKSVDCAACCICHYCSAQFRHCKMGLTSPHDSYGSYSPGGGTPRKIGWGCAARFPKPLPYL